MNIDNATRKLLAELGRQYLHVAGQTQQINPVLKHELSNASLLPGPGFWRDRLVIKRQTIPFSQGAHAVVIRYYPDNFRR